MLLVCCVQLVTLLLPRSLLVAGKLQVSDMNHDTTRTMRTLNIVLEEAKACDTPLIIIIQGNFKSSALRELRAPSSIGVFKVERESHNISLTEERMIQLISGVRQLMQVSKSMVLAIVSDDPAFLATFIEWSLKGRLLLWSTRLLVLTRLPLHRLHHLNNTLSMTNSMLLLLKQKPELRYDAYVYQPYSTMTDKPRLVASWIHLAIPVFKQYRELFPEKFEKLSERPRLRVARQPLPTTRTQMVEDPSAPGGKRIVILTEKVSLLETIAIAMNFTFQFVAPTDGAWGTKLPNGSWTGMMGMITRQEVDFGLGFYGLTQKRAEAIDFASPVSFLYGRIIVGRKDPEVDPWSFFLPFTPIVWVGVFAALLGLQFSTLLLHSCYSYKAIRWSTSRNSLFDFVRVLLQQDVSRVMEWWCERVVVGVWMLTTLVVTRSYAGSLTSLLAVQYIPMPIQSLQDVVDHPVTFLVQKGTVKTQAFLTAKSGILHDVGNLRTENRLEAFNAAEMKKKLTTLVRQGSHVQMNIENIAMKMIAQDFSRIGRCDFYLGREEFLPLIITMAGPQGSPLVPAISRRIMPIIEAGLFNYWSRLYTPNFTSCLNPPTKVVIKSSLTLKNVRGMLVVLACGAAVSLLVLVGELIYWRLMHLTTTNHC